jgi:hypothetical protein
VALRTQFAALCRLGREAASGDPPGSTTATGAYRVKNLLRTDLPISVHTRKVIVEFISGPDRMPDAPYEGDARCASIFTAEFC